MGKSKMFSSGKLALVTGAMLVMAFVFNGSANADGLSNMTGESDISAISHRLSPRNSSSLVWQASKAEAISLAKAQGKKILLVAEGNTATYTRNTLCETDSPKIKCLIEQNFIPWFYDIDSGNDWWAYTDGLTNAQGSVSLPVICCIDPNDSDNYLGNTAGNKSADEFYSWLRTFTGTDCLTVSISGYVRDSQGNGIPEVMLSFSGGGLARTDSDGHYEYGVTSGWSGTAKPCKIGYTFSPETLSYSNHTSALDNQDYIADLSDPDADYIFEVYHTGRVAELLMRSQEFEDWNSGAFSDDTKREEVGKFLYTHFKDDFDFMFLISNNEELPDGLDYHGRCVMVRNEVEGIGYSIYDYTESYGSSGRLRSIIHMPYIDGLDNGPSLHELLHTWANGLVETSMQSHWGFSSGGGQLGGFAPDTLLYLGDGIYQANNGRENSSSFGEFANGGNSVPYSDIELYLMGMIGKSQVQPLQVAINPEWVEYGKFRADGFLTYTMEDIVQEHGERKPSVAESQKRFRAIAVVLTPTPLTEQERSEVDEDVKWFSQEEDDGDAYSNNFWEATRGIATIEMDKLFDSLTVPITLSPTISVSPESVSFGEIGAGSSESQTLVISNLGNAPLEIGTLSVTGTDAYEFEIQNDTCSAQMIVALSQTCTVEVKLAPASEGEKNATLQIPSNDPNTPTLDVTLDGTGAIPGISGIPESLTFGKTAVGSSDLETITIGNSGSAPLEIATLSITGTDASEFEIQNDTCSAQTVAPSQTCTVEVKLAPASEGEKNATLQIPSNDPDTPTLTVSLAMQLPIISISPLSFTNGVEKLYLSASAIQKFTIRNAGRATLEIGTLSITGTDASEFQLRKDSCSGQTVAASETCSFDMILTPESAGEKIASLEIISDASNEPLLSIPLNRTAYEKPEWTSSIPGDIDNSGGIDLRDIILAIQICVNEILVHPVYARADTDGDSKISLSEAIYGLQVLSE